MALLLISFIAFSSLFYYTLSLGISPMPTSFRTIREMEKHLPKEISGTILEMGSGWGHVALFFSKKYKGAQVIGFEKSWIPYLFSKIFSLGRKNLQFKRLDFRKISIKEADLVYCYLFPKGMEEMAKKRGGERLISNTFALPGTSAEKEIELLDLYRTKLYLYGIFDD